MSKPNFIWNPKVKESGIITCIPQEGLCPNKCEDCFFQSGRSYLEPLDKNLPQIPSVELTKNRVVRFNDGNDSNNKQSLVIECAKQYEHAFFNTAIPKNLDKFDRPVVLTINPAKMTDTEFYKVLDPVPKNLMFVRIRTNLWNLKDVVVPAVEYYTNREVPVVLTFMAYYTETIPEQCKIFYDWKKRTLNDYWVLKRDKVEEVERLFKDNPYVYSCTYKGKYECKFCGNCIREYYRTIERCRKED